MDSICAESVATTLWPLMRETERDLLLSPPRSGETVHVQAKTSLPLVPRLWHGNTRAHLGLIHVLGQLLVEDESWRVAVSIMAFPPLIVLMAHSVHGKNN